MFYHPRDCKHNQLILRMKAFVALASVFYIFAFVLNGCCAVPIVDPFCESWKHEYCMHPSHLDLHDMPDFTNATRKEEIREAMQEAAEDNGIYFWDDQFSDAILERLDEFKVAENIGVAVQSTEEDPLDIMPIGIGLVIQNIEDVDYRKGMLVADLKAYLTPLDLGMYHVMLAAVDANG